MGTWFSKKPWRLIPDGDLWEVFERVIKSRGADSTAISWTKGHASWQWIKDHVTNAESIANGQADYAAGAGVRALGMEETQLVLDFHANKLRAYEVLVGRMQMHAAQLLHHDRELRREREVADEGRRQAASFIDMPSPPTRVDFTDGVSLDLLPLPPSTAPHIKTDSQEAITDPQHLHVFWSSLRWTCDSGSRHTTWLELFALYRLKGAGPRIVDPHSPRLPLTAALKAFIKASKAMLSISATGSALALLRHSKAKLFHLATYGVMRHCSAVAAELCLEEGVASTIHSMLTTIRRVKQGANKGKLICTASPLPKQEPWYTILTSAPSPLEAIMTTKRARLLDSIDSRGERGDQRELRPISFMINCPHCGVSKDCAKVRLFSTVARSVSCTSCLRNTSSTRWLCSHGAPWTSCLVHREAGFRCGSQSLHIKKRSHDQHRFAKATKAKQRKQARLHKLGILGEPKCPSMSVDNSVGSSTFQGTLVRKNKVKRRGKFPSPKRDSSMSRPGKLHNIENPHTKLDDCKVEHGKHDYSHIMSTSSIWQAHVFKGQPGGSTSSDRNSCCHHSTQQTGSGGLAPLNIAKRARLSSASSSRRAVCRGNCPTRWTIESYCEVCHG